ncbi:MAG TPA: 30S ribosomal protein S1 [Phaeodactylibacter sp.]|nr:30S ribosomal protein S1 [Phaeodactylibacter sp.]
MSDDKNLKTSSEEEAVQEKSTEEITVDAIALEDLVEKTETQFSTPHDDFDWELGNGLASPYTDEEKAEYLKIYEETLSLVLEGEIVKGKVASIQSGDVVLDINYKSDGLLSLSEFRDMPDLAVGDVVDVYVEKQEDERGQLILSRRKAKLLKAWEDIVDSHQNGTIIKGTVVSKTKGGLIVDASGLETFLPGSQIDIKPIIDYDAYIGKTMEFKVVKINEIIKNAVVSHKALIESDLAEQREAIIGRLEKGQVLEGLVKNITDFGAFLDLGGVDGLLYITDISWGRISHPSEVLSLNQKINVVVLDFDENKKRISLGLKQLQPHPWEVLGEEIQAGSTVKGKIVNIEDYGAFLEIQPGVEGLIHVSEVTWSNQPVNARDYFKLGQEYDAKIVTVNREDRKMSLSVKQLTDDPWNKIEELFPVESRHTGKVKNLTPYGVFVELNEGIGGMVHISDLSWIKRFSHPSEFTKIGNDIDVVILDINKDHRKLSLGHKQVEENPWDTFETVFPVGSYHEATVVRRDDRGAIVQLPYGLEAFAPIKHIRKEDGKLANVDEALTVKVIEFNRDDKRILVSHLRYLDDIRREADETVRQEKQQVRKETNQSIKKQQAKMERSTLGELAGFDKLKQQLAADMPKPPPLKKATPPPVEEKKEEVAAVVEEKVETPTPVVEEKKEEVAAVVEEKVEMVAAAPSAEDDLKKIEGVGPKIEQLMKDGGLKTFAQVAAVEPQVIKDILLAAGNRYKMHDPTSWPLQAKMAAEGKWDELNKWQDEHKGGRM